MPDPAPRSGQSHRSGSRPARRPRRTARPASRPVSRPAKNPDQEYERRLDAALDQAAAAPTETRDFADFTLPHRLVRGLARGGITAPFAIQARALPDALAGRDILGRAQTGSGKTLAFGIPLLARLAAEAGAGMPRGLVLVPTRELAQQVTDVLGPLATRIGLKVTSVYGGSSMRRQINALRTGVDIVVATPGRLIDLQEQGECHLDQVVISVLDEADHMADLGFLPSVTRILDSTPADGQRMLFSATLDRGVAGLVRQYLTEPAVHAVAKAAAPVESVTHKTFVLRHEHKVAVAAEIADRPGRTLFFVRTRHGADRLATQLGRSGVQAAAIHGDLGQGRRQRALSGFASGAPRVLVATDVAARGIHVDDLDLVVHFDPSEDPKDYLHRSGRTARAGATGTVVSLALPDQRRTVSRMLEQAKVRAESVDVEPGHDAVREIATSGTPVVVRAEPEEDRPASRRKGSRPHGRRRSPGRSSDRSGRSSDRGDRSGRSDDRSARSSGRTSDRSARSSDRGRPVRDADRSGRQNNQTSPIGASDLPARGPRKPRKPRKQGADQRKAA